MSEIKELATIFATINQAEVMQEALSEILTEKELKDVALRLKLMKKIKQGASQREIATELGVSLCKITRGSKILKRPQSVFNQLLNSRF